MSFAEAASLPVNHLTAFYSLLDSAHAERRRILIHAAAGGVGQVMIQGAQHLRLDIFATVGSQEKRDLLVEKYGLRSEHILSSRDTTFGPALRRLTAGQRVDITINSLAGDLARESWACLASRGMFVELGKAQQVYQQADDRRDVQFLAFDLENIARDRPQTISTHLDGMMKLLESGVTRVVTPLRTCPADEAPEVFRSMASGKHSGKTVLLWDMPTSVRFIREVLPQPPLLKLDSAVTYLLVGGLGGLGRSLAYHLARNGARHLCFLSRPGLAESDHRAQRLVRDLQDQFNVSVKCYSCDVGDYEQFVSAVDRCTRDGPPIRGVIQGAMALHDTVLANMTSQRWKQSLRPKVAGTWNLHRLFADGSLDFFILLSSFVTIIGNPGQANHSAACAFQDDLARHRHSLGLKCVSINLGIMKDVGVLVDGNVAASVQLLHFENGAISRAFANTSFYV